MSTTGATRAKTHHPLTGAVWLAAGLLLVACAWMTPVNLKSLTPALLREAGRGTPSVADHGRQRIESEKLGSAKLILAAARLAGDPGADALALSIQNVETRRPEWVPWGGWDPFLDPLFNLKENTGRAASTPVLEFFITQKARQSLLLFLSGSRSLGVQSVLQTRDIQGTTRFVPATHPGGQSLDAVILLTALLYQSENLSGPLQRELRGLAEAAVAQKQMGPLEDFFIDLLSLGKRLDWMQLAGLLRVSGGARTVGEFAQLARVAADDLPLIYAAALFTGSADTVAGYLMRYGKNGLADLRLALAEGEGAARLLLDRQIPVNHAGGPVLGPAATLALVHPQVMLAAKYLGFFLGAFCLFHAIERLLAAASPGALPLRARSGILAALIGALLVLATEPFLVKAAPPSEFRLKLLLPVLSDSPVSPVRLESATPPNMDSATIISIGVFAFLQIAMYLICLFKIRGIERQVITPQLKLRLMENEENLFDGGLYIGIAGTATALVLQVMGIIQANLLAAYSSNLFGILCVAIVKIRHVRNAKRRLILEATAGAANAEKSQ
ncbi:MAG: hypothetical protein LBM92_04990 [Opitutaceae bacterium]|jgi:hypothetical protein|nr:hypothetical protein [Opitutaceae bacterium]